MGLPQLSSSGKAPGAPAPVGDPKSLEVIKIYENHVMDWNVFEIYLWDVDESSTEGDAFPFIRLDCDSYGVFLMAPS